MHGSPPLTCHLPRRAGLRCDRVQMLSPSQVRTRIHLLRPWRYNRVDRMIQAYASLLCLALCVRASWIGIETRRCRAVFSGWRSLGFLPPTCGSPSTGILLPLLVGTSRNAPELMVHLRKFHGTAAEQAPKVRHTP